MAAVADHYRAVLIRVGSALLIVGALDIVMMVYCMANGIAYRSSFNIFAVALGILLIRGSLWAASFVRFFSAFFIAGGIGLIVSFPFLQPMALTLTELRHTSPLAIAPPLALLALSLWIVRELNAEPVLAAWQSAGKRVSPLVFPVILGFGLVVGLAGVLAFT